MGHLSTCRSLSWERYLATSPHQAPSFPLQIPGFPIPQEPEQLLLWAALQGCCRQSLNVPQLPRLPRESCSSLRPHKSSLCCCGVFQ